VKTYRDFAVVKARLMEGISADLFLSMHAK